MPQSTKDSRGGKNQANKKQHQKGTASEARADTKSRSAKSPTGSHKHGEKKTTP